MYDTKKKFRRSAATTVCYVLAALMLIYTCYQIGSTIHTINEYYGQYGMQATPVEYLTYTLQNALTPLINTVIFFMLAKILDEVRKNNPANYQSDEDIVEADIAKKEAKDAKKFAKGEKAAAKAAEKSGAREPGETREDGPVVADFTTEEKKPEEAKAEEPEAEEAKPEEAKPEDTEAEEAKPEETEAEEAKPEETEAEEAKPEEPEAEEASEKKPARKSRSRKSSAKKSPAKKSPAGKETEE